MTHRDLASGARHLLRRRRPAPDHPGWRIDPGDNGRGTPAPARDRTRPPWFWILLGLVALNLWIVGTVTRGPARAEVPYEPVFIAQVTAGNVAEVTFTGDDITGRFREPVRVPVGVADSTRE